LEQIHNAGFIHRDIKPDNIFIRNDGSPVLLDFGSARQALCEQTKTLTSLITPGYAPFEQYFSKSDEQGEYTDIYGLGATLYRAISGVPPMDAADRSNAILKSKDTLVPAMEIGKGRYSERFLKAIDHAIQFRAEDRPQTIKEWKSEFELPEDPIKEAEVIEQKITEPGTKVLESRQQKKVWSLGMILLVGLIISVVISFYYRDEIKNYFGSTKDVEEITATHKQVPPEKGQPVDLFEKYGITPPNPEELKRKKEEQSQAELERQRIEEQQISQPLVKIIKEEPKKEESIEEQLDKAVSAYKAKQYDEVVRIVQPLADQGIASAQRILGGMYATGQGVSKNLSHATYWTRKAAEQGDVNAQHNISLMYIRGEGVTKDLKQAAQWAQKAAEQGGVDAQFNLGLMYTKGEGVTKDDKQAESWFRKAAEQGKASAQYNLGLMYDTGEGVTQDDKQAVSWYQKAAEQGHASAQSNLGAMYSNGEGVIQDDVQAHKWFNIVSANGNENAKNNREIIENSMTSEQIAKANELAREWMEAHQGLRKTEDQTQSKQEQQSITLEKERLKEEKIQTLLSGAQEDINTLRLTSPEGNNALEKYQKILELDSENTESRQGIQNIVDKYIALAKQAANNGEYDKAIANLDKADKILPDSEKIKTVREEIGLKVKEEEEQRLAELEKQRQAEEKRLTEEQKSVAEIERKRKEELILQEAMTKTKSVEKPISFGGIYVGNWTSIKYGNSGKAIMSLQDKGGRVEGKLEVFGGVKFHGDEFLGVVESFTGGTWIINLEAKNSRFTIRAIINSREFAGEWIYKFGLFGKDIGAFELLRE